MKIPLNRRKKLDKNVYKPPQHKNKFIINIIFKSKKMITIVLDEEIRLLFKSESFS